MNWIFHIKRYGKRILLYDAGIIILIYLSAILIPLPQPKPCSLVVKDRKGEFLSAYLARDGVWRIKTRAHEIPSRLKDILILKEDKYFFYHPGVNPIAVMRALVQNISAGKTVSGASTITMQVARLLEPKTRTIVNKCIEMFRAIQLEIRYSKMEILEMYLSTIPLGGNIEGLESAAMLYYQTPLERLNIAHLFDLIIIPNNPNHFRPDKHPERLYLERIKQSDKYIKKGILTKEDSITIFQTPAETKRNQLPQQAQHFCLRLKSQSCLSSDVISTLDWQVQQQVEKLLVNHLRPWKQRGVHNGAILVIENASRDILAYVGSDDFSDSLAQGQVDAVRAVRSPGSTLKPFLCAMLMDKGLLTPKTRLLDLPYDIDGYSAENYDGAFSGYVFTDEALMRSLNVPFIRLLKNAGVQQFTSVLSTAGFQSLQNQQQLGLSMIVGGCGVTLEELTAAFAVFPNNGSYAPLQYILRDIKPPEFQVFSASSSFMVTEILSGLDRPDLPNNFESALNLPRVAFKTGTSYGRRDAWTIGYSSEFTVGVWIGNVTNAGNPELAGRKAATPLLIEVFNSITRNPNKSILPMPDDINTRDVCIESGKLPNQHCKHLIEDYYSISSTLQYYCDIDKEYFVSADGKFQYCSSCLPQSNYRTVVYQDYPPELITFWKQIGKHLNTPPKHNPSCDRFFSGDGPHILNPSKGTTYFISYRNQKIPFQASSGVDVCDHIWYIDRKFFGKKKSGEKFFLELEPGNHNASCADEKGRISTINFYVTSLF
ncbi:MAG: penicillin-binding protein 1C [Bacteroidetes bacterium]|nr:penicillin-binding protein 1C [Bacteroidota bacterium]